MGFGVVDKIQQAQRINSKESFDATGSFVIIATFGLDTSIAGIFHLPQTLPQNTSIHSSKGQF
jgi:hypothetical protein